MTITKEVIDQLIEVEKEIIAQLTPHPLVGKAIDEDQELARTVSQVRLTTLIRIRFTKDFDGHAKAWEEANSPKDDTP